ncbi:hypothetical protein QJS66_19435 [Kocuria rhizophila]|nr:hypothetical protein QJS66_19435 [Kocuria rhizophila]
MTGLQPAIVTAGFVTGLFGRVVDEAVAGIVPACFEGTDGPAGREHAGDGDAHAISTPTPPCADRHGRCPLRPCRGC